MYMTLLYGHTDTPDAILLRTQVGGHLYKFPDQTIRPMPEGARDTTTSPSGGAISGAWSSRVWTCRPRSSAATAFS